MKIRTYQNEFEVEKITGKCYSNSRLFYKIKKKGYPNSQSTREQLSHLQNAQKSIKILEKTNRDKRNSRRRANQKIKQVRVKFAEPNQKRSIAMKEKKRKRNT